MSSCVRLVSSTTRSSALSGMLHQVIQLILPLLMPPRYTFTSGQDIEWDFDLETSSKEVRRHYYY
ncbi:hypothetical protein MANES_13G088269v8 [Manihot esculenta]|uniref:Uncharacterized protein n=1 Tax=Manihot esculenta TaxID=3983 RepID=A0A2C9UPY1_MANES|nr:hypothetical protein MANES_13G088269v8 [Manihot esculenta]